MKQIIVGPNVLALPERVFVSESSVEYDLYKTCATKYGLFIPTAVTGYHLVRWINSGCKDPLEKDSIASNFIHVSNHGEIFLGSAITEDNYISLMPYTADVFTLFGSGRDRSEAFTALFKLKKCKTIAQCVSLVEKNDSDGFPNAKIFFIEDWVKHAAEQGYTENFYKASFKPPQ